MLKQDYFKGWYFKCSNKDKTIAFIPAFHKNNRKQSASLQVITEDAAFHIPSDTLNYQEKPLSVKFGNCIFSRHGMKLNIKNDSLTIQGTLRFHHLSPIRYNIMGPFQFVPFMQCRHSVYSMRHQIDGQLICNGQQLNFQNGTGYIEGDCGSSFPKQYVWTQCCFQNGSLMLSVADIPMFRTHFTGMIGVILLNKTEYRLATYLGAKLKYVGENAVIVEQGDYEFTAALMKKNAQPLYAPDNGRMSRTIHESASCQAYYRFSRKGKLLCEFISDKASFEFEFQ
ncbi:MAG: hypothetical protein J1E35_09720 [Lachnospiraceae bacterium]|nr:hypothetical protein [Lachnospiraceae bacterium]